MIAEMPAPPAQPATAPTLPVPPIPAREAALPRFASPEDPPARALEGALADPNFVAEVWPSGERAWLVVEAGRPRLIAAGAGGARFERARLLLADPAIAAPLASLGDAVFDGVLVGHGEVRFDALDCVRLDGADFAALPYAIRALALADALERIRTAAASGTTGFLRAARTPAVGAEKRRWAADPAPVRLALRDLRVPYGMRGGILRLPSPTAGFFDDPWREGLDPA